MHQLRTLLATRVGQGLRRKSIRSVSAWAQHYRIMGQPFPGQWSFKYHPWARELHDCNSEIMIGQKGAQLAYTETALNKAFYAIDVEGKSVLYVLPANNPDAGDFSTSRFDPALELSPHLQGLFTSVKNIGHKRAGSANLFVRGSRSRSQMKSIPVGLIIFDEVDEMMQANLPLALERSSGQMEKQAFYLSTPTIDNYGINTYFRSSTQEHYFFKCPHCSRQTELLFPDCMIITTDDFTDQKIYDTHLICKECKHKLIHETKHEWLKAGKWVAKHTDRISRGFHISQLYSSTVRPYELATSYIKAQSDPSDEQEFYNSKLGLTHVVEGARINDKDIADCIGTHKKQDVAPANSFVTMGIDVGKWLHYEITQWWINTGGPDINTNATGRVLRESKVLNFDELDMLMRAFQVNHCVIDANPERRKALEFAQKFWGRVRLCFYARGISSKNIIIHNEEEHTISVDRTSWLDLSLGRIRRRKLSLPIDTSQEYKSHLKALVRIYDKDSDGNPVGKYVTGSEDDHFAHARNYCEIALPLGASLAANQDIGTVL